MSVSSILLDPDNPSAQPEIWSDLNVQSVQAIDIVADNISGTSVDATKLRGVPISSTAPTATQVLTYNGSQWAPAAGGGGGGGGIPYSSGTVDLYIDSVSGNDANDGLSAGPSGAVQTWNRLLEIGSGYNVDEIIIHLVAGQTLNALTSTLDTPIEEYDVADLYVINNVLDFSPLGARSVKVMTDLVSPTILTPSATAGWQTTTGGPGFVYFDHSSLTGLVGADRWLYNATADRYVSSDWLQNGSIRTYCVDWSGSLVPYTFYDRSQIAMIELTGETLINAPNKSVVFERMSFRADGSIKLNGDLIFRGCDVAVLSVAFLSGFELLCDSCRVGALVAYDGVFNLNFVYSDDTVQYERNSSGGLSYCYVDTLDMLNNNNVRAYNTEIIGGNIEIANNSRVVFDSCGATNNTSFVHDGCAVLVNQGAWQECQFNLVKNSVLSILSMAVTCAVDLVAQSGSKIYVTGCNLTSRGGTGIMLQADEYAEITIQGGTIADVLSGLGSANPLIQATDFSTINVKSNAINTVCNRTSTLIHAINGSKIWLPGITVSSALTVNDLVDIDKNSELYLSAATQMNTTQNMIHVQGASKILSTVSPTNAGTGTVLQKGGTAALGVWTFDTTYGGMVTATDEMTLVLLI